MRSARAGKGRRGRSDAADPPSTARTEDVLNMDTLLRMRAWYDASQMRARAEEIDAQRYDSHPSR